MTAVAAGTFLDRLVAWIGAKADSKVTVEELYGHGPESLKTTEVELREAVNEGLKQRRLAIGGLTSTILVRTSDLH